MAGRCSNWRTGLGLAALAQPGRTQRAIDHRAGRAEQRLQVQADGIHRLGQPRPGSGGNR